MCKSFLITKVKKDTDTGPQPVHALAQRRAGKIVFIVGGPRIVVNYCCFADDVVGRTHAARTFDSRGRVSTWRP